RQALVSLSRRTPQSHAVYRYPARLLYATLALEHLSIPRWYEAPMDDDQRSHLDGLRQAHLRRLRILEQQAAITGVNTRPEVLTEIEDLRATIAQIESQLAATTEAPS